MHPCSLIRAFVIHLLESIKSRLESWLICFYCLMDVLLQYCICSVAIPHGAVGWSVVCDCGIFWSYSLTFCHNWNFNCLACLCSWTGWFEPHFLRNPKTGFVASGLIYNKPYHKTLVLITYASSPGSDESTQIRVCTLSLEPSLLKYAK